MICVSFLNELLPVCVWSPVVFTMLDVCMFLFNLISGLDIWLFGSVVLCVYSHDKRSQAVEMGPKQSMWLVAAVIGQEVPAVWLQACLGETCSSESQQRLLMLAACHPACAVEHSLSLQAAGLPAQDLGGEGDACHSRRGPRE